MIDKQFIIRLHFMLIDASGGSHGIRDERLLESAISAPYVSFNGKEKYLTTEEKAARLAYGLVQNHAFIDGNKRIGVCAMLVFLESNNIRLKITDDELVQLGLSLAQNKASYEDVYKWIESHK